MRIETDEGFVTLIAKDDAEANMLAPIAAAINAEVGSPFPAQLIDYVEDSLPGRRIINGTLQLQVSG